MSDLLKVALLLSVMGSSWSCGKKAITPAQQPSAAAQQPPAVLPSGCAIAATLNPAAFPASEEMWTAFLDTRGLKGSELRAAGFDVQRYLTRVAYCATPSRQGAAQRAFVVIASGRIPGKLLEEKIQNPGQATTTEAVGQTMISGQGGVWIARRGPLVGPSQVLISNDHDLMVATLAGPAGSYPFEASDSFSAVIEGSEIRPQQRASEHSNDSGMGAVHAVRLSISPQVDALMIRLVVNDQSVSDQLAKTVGVVLSSLVKRALGEGHEPPKLSTTSAGGDVVARLVLPEDGLNSLMERMLASRRRR